jgi:hypothetical protein
VLFYLISKQCLKRGLALTVLVLLIGVLSLCVWRLFDLKMMGDHNFYPFIHQCICMQQRITLLYKAVSLSVISLGKHVWHCFFP